MMIVTDRVYGNCCGDVTVEVIKKPPFIVYDTSIDENSRCNPSLDEPLYPNSYRTGKANSSFEVRFTAVARDGRNYWITGRMTSRGDMRTPFHVDCRTILISPHNSDGSLQMGSQWIMGAYKTNDGSLYTIVHNEYYGGSFPPADQFLIASSPGCSLGVSASQSVNPGGCTYASLVGASLKRGASHFILGGSAAEYVIARPSFNYEPNLGRPTGYFVNTNIVRGRDGYYYALTVIDMPGGAERRCPIRTSDISHPSTWVGWSNLGFKAKMSQGDDCDSVNIPIFPFYLAYSTYLGGYIAVGGVPVSKASSQIAFTLSKDLVNWSTPVSFDVPLFDAASANSWAQNNYPSLFDPLYLSDTENPDSASGTRVGQSPWLVFVQRKYNQSRAVGIPIKFSRR